MGMPTVQSGFRCYHCGSMETCKAGFSKYGQTKKQRFFCRVCRRYFREDPQCNERTSDRSNDWVRKYLPSARHLILELREIAQYVLGKTPRAIDINELSKQKRANSVNTYYAVFGSFREALKQASLTPEYPRQYDHEKIFEELRGLRTRLNRPISRSDIVTAWKEWNAPSPYFLKREFGTVTKALKAAGIGQKYTREEMIDSLRKLDARIEGPVGEREITESFRRGEGPSSTAVRLEFGGFEKARCAAGVKTEKGARPDRIADRKLPSESDLILKLYALARSLGRTPTSNDILEPSKKGRMASLEVYRAVFGRWSTALERVRLVLRDKPEIDKETLIRELRALREKLKRPLLAKDILGAWKKGRMSSPDQFRRAFGTLTHAFKAAGVGKSFNREELIKYLRSLDAIYDRPIHPSDITKLYRAGKGPSFKVIVREFGGMIKARRAAGTKKVYLTKRKGWSPGPKYTQGELISQLKRLAKHLGRKPTKREIDAASKLGTCAASVTIAKTFGSLQEAYQAAGLEMAKASRRYSDEEILAAIEKLSKEFGRMPTYGEFESASRKGKCPYPDTIVRRIGKLTDLRSRFT